MAGQWFNCCKCFISTPWSDRHDTGKRKNGEVQYACQECFLKEGAQKFVDTLGPVIKKLAKE